MKTRTMRPKVLRNLDRHALHLTVGSVCIIIAITLAIAARTEPIVGPSSAAAASDLITRFLLLSIAWLIAGSALCRKFSWHRIGVAITIVGPVLAALACLWWWGTTLNHMTIAPTSLLWSAVALLAAAIGVGAALTTPPDTDYTSSKGRASLIGTVSCIGVTALLISLPPTHLPGDLSTTGVVAEQPLPQRELSEDTELLWCRAFERRSWMLNSDSGPTIVTRTTAQLLDPATGQTVWTYTRRSDSSQQLITSAEVRDSGSTVALEYEVSSSAYRYPETVLLDAETGETLGWEHAELLSNGSGGREPDAGLTWVNPMYPHGNKMDDASAFDVIFDADGNSFTIVLDARILPQDTYLIEKRLYDAGSMYLLEVLPASSADTKLVCGLY